MFVTVDHKREFQAIEISTGTVLARVPVPISISGAPPLELVISPNGSVAYVYAPQDMPDSLLLAIDTRTYRVTHSLTLPFNESQGPMLISPDGKQLYFEVGLVKQYIQVVDTAALTAKTQIPVDESPFGMAVTPSGLILMTDTANELLVIDPRSASIVNRYQLTNQTQIVTGAVVSSADSATAYISFSSFSGPSILAVNISTGATVFDAPTGYRPVQFALSSDGKSLYSIDFSTTGRWSVSEFDIQNQKPVATVGQLGPLSALALAQSDLRLYVLNRDNSAIASVDTFLHKTTGVTLGGVGLNSAAIPAGGRNVWASSDEFAAGGAILVLNPATGQLRYSLGPAGALTFSPDGKTLYVTSPSAVEALDASTLQEIAIVHAGELENFGQAIASPDGKKLYVSLTFVSGSPSNGPVVLPPGVIVVFDAANLKAVGSINIPDGVGGLALTPDGSTLLCSSNHGHLHLISAATNKITSTIALMPTNGELVTVAVSLDGSMAYVTDAVNNLLLAAQLSTAAQTATVAVGRDPINVALAPDGSEAWVLTEAGLEIVTLSNSQVSGPVRLPGTPSAIVFAP